MHVDHNMHVIGCNMHVTCTLFRIGKLGLHKWKMRLKKNERQSNGPVDHFYLFIYLFINHSFICLFVFFICMFVCLFILYVFPELYNMKM